MEELNIDSPSTDPRQPYGDVSAAAINAAVGRHGDVTVAAESAERQWRTQ